MLNTLKIWLQYLSPQVLLSRFAGFCANSSNVKWKNWVIKTFVRHYQVDLNIAQINNIEDYPTFNSFFTRKLKPSSRAIAPGEHEIVSPVDGTISQIGKIKDDVIFQAKGFYYSLITLLGGESSDAEALRDGIFATFYLAPRDYHRVHIPFAGRLKKTIYIPGQLFSVNQLTTSAVPNLFARNERLVCFFETSMGPMVIILVGAMLVSQIRTVWENKTDPKKITVQTFENDIQLEKGEELGHFQMGSTVIVLFPKNTVTWEACLAEDSKVLMGERIGSFKDKVLRTEY